MKNGLMLQGGFNTGVSGNDYCDVRRAIPEWTVILADPDQPVVRHVVWMGDPRDGARLVHDSEDRVQVAGTLRSDQGAPLAANWTAPNSEPSASTGRLPASAARP